MSDNKTTTLNQYPATKPSGIPWLESLPNHWGPTRIQHLASPEAKSFTDGDWIESPYITTEGIRLIQTGNVGVGEFVEKGYRYITDATFEELNCTEVEPGDILICRLGDPVARACAAPHLGKRMITSVDVCIVKSRKGLNSGFAIYAMSSRPYLDWVTSLVRGSTRDRISRSMLGKFVIPLPPPYEQAAIVRYLDDADQRIRAYMSVKERLIALLEEERQALVHQAVTRGLDPSIRLKPSGVEWLGDVPEHWEVRPLKHWCHINRETLPENTDPDYEFNYLDISCVGTGFMTNQPQTTAFKNAPSRARRIARQGDTVISTVRTYLKAVYHIEQEWQDLIASTGFAVLSPGESVYPALLSYTVQEESFVETVTANSVGVAYPAISETKLGTIPIPISPDRSRTTVNTQGNLNVDSDGSPIPP